MKIKEHYTVGIYCRLSRDDKKKEGLSIENQERICRGNVEDRGWTVYDVYPDIDYTGMNFNRPQLDRLFKDLKAKRIDCVIVKSVDRFGRGSQTEDMIEKHFVIPQVRFIALGENVDTINGTDYLLGLIHAMNGIYPQMVSNKVKQVKRENQARGMFMNSQAPFGYVKSPADKHKLIIDEVAEVTVLRMFKEYADGDSARLIADRFNSEGIDSPRFYYYNRTGKPKPQNLLEQKNAWVSGTIMQLLRNEVYIGNLISGRREVASIKTKQMRLIDPEYWTRVEGTHDAIISRELWDKVHARIDAQYSPRKTQQSEVIGIFSGLMRCGDCNARLSYMTKQRKLSAEKGIYRCGKYNQSGTKKGKGCTSHYIHETELVCYVLNDIRQYAVLSERQREQLAKRLMSYMGKSRDVEANVIRGHIQKAKTRLDFITSTLKTLYEDRVAGDLSIDDYKRMKKEYDHEKSLVEEQLPRLQRELDQCNEVTGEINQWLDLVASCVDLEILDRETATGLIDTITVSETVREDGKKTREIEISYRFIGSLLSKAKEDAAAQANVLSGAII